MKLRLVNPEYPAKPCNYYCILKKDFTIKLNRQNLILRFMIEL